MFPTSTFDNGKISWAARGRGFLWRLLTSFGSCDEHAHISPLYESLESCFQVCHSRNCQIRYNDMNWICRYIQPYGLYKQSLFFELTFSWLFSNMQLRRLIRAFAYIERPALLYNFWMYMSWFLWYRNADFNDGLHSIQAICLSNFKSQTVSVAKWNDEDDDYNSLAE